MLKWTVKKRFAGEQQLDDDYESVNGVKKTRTSLGNVLGDNQSKNVSKYHRRRSLGSQLCNERVKVDKENHLVTPVRRKSNRQTPLGDSSNKRRENCNKRKHHLISSTALTSPTISPISFNFKEVFVEPSAIIFPSSYAPTLPTFDVEYSPVMKSSQNLVKSSIRVNDEVPIKRMKMDLMDLSYEFHPESASTSSPLSTPLVSRKVINEKKVPLNLSNDSESSLNSSEVGDTTLQKMIDDILASARNGKKFKSGLAESKKTGRDTNANFMKNLSEICENMEEKSIVKLLSPEKITEAADKTIIIANTEIQNEREVKSPMVKKDVEIVDFRADETCQLKRQNAVRRKNTSNENKNKKKCEESQGKSQKEFQDSSIQKCLSFSSANFDDVSDKFKRSSVASYSSGSSNSYVSQSKYTKNLLMKGPKVKLRNFYKRFFMFMDNKNRKKHNESIYKNFDMVDK
ncbi:CLUMA_CG010523, isoform A [Clunio marinus]|uniref:CLUMA_CG010523, isoform A n=1 Tax=Clunio marinus TaxID=568069 RepID=A0A1J1IDQ7_9DIPT|nr:CLUMA_CG010523, isoform A [Clunio marinus]